MSEMTSSGVIPQWDAADRLAKALRQSGVSVANMADYLGVHRNTIGRYLNGRGGAADRRTILLWAMRTGVPAAWLEHGVIPPSNGGGGERARRDSNSRPWD